MRLIVRRLRTDDRGMSLLELMVVGFLGALLLAGMGGFIASAMTSGTFTQGQSATLNNVRNAMQQIEKELRGAESINWDCGPSYAVGSCLVIGAQTPTSQFRTVRYAKRGTVLERELFSPGLAAWGEPTTIISRVANTPAQPVFGCDEGVTLLRVAIDLWIQPTPSRDAPMNVETSVRPRNFPSSAGVCP